MTDPWPPERCAELTRLWSENVSVSNIARALGTNKNAVAGKAHRMDLPRRESPIKRYDVPTTEGVRWAPLTLNSFRAWRAEGLTYRQIGLLCGKTQHQVRNWVIEQGLSGERPAMVGTQPKRRATNGMRFKACQWISGEPSWNDACKCLRPTERGLPYCPEHHARAYNGLSRGRGPADFKLPGEAV